MRHRKRASWIALVDQCERSGLSQRAFADERDLPVATLRSWIYRLRREKTEAPRLLPVRVVPSTAPTARWPEDADSLVEVTFPDGVRLRFGARVNVDAVADLIARLRSVR